MGTNTTTGLHRWLLRWVEASVCSCVLRLLSALSKDPFKLRVLIFKATLINHCWVFTNVMNWGENCIAACWWLLAAFIIIVVGCCPMWPSRTLIKIPCTVTKACATAARASYKLLFELRISLPNSYGYRWWLTKASKVLSMVLRVLLTSTLHKLLCLLCIELLLNKFGNCKVIFISCSFLLELSSWLHFRWRLRCHRHWRLRLLNILSPILILHYSRRLLGSSPTSSRTDRWFRANLLLNHPLFGLLSLSLDFFLFLLHYLILFFFLKFG